MAIHAVATSSDTPKSSASRAIGDDDPISIGDLKVIEAASFWPYGSDGTYRLVRSGALRAIVIGRRRYVTIRTLRECLARHMTTATATAGVGR